MKTIVASQVLPLPKNVTVSVNSRVVTVKGPRGELTRRFKHTDAEMEIIGGKKRKLKVTIWFGKRKNLACIRTICTHIKNMIVGVTKGYEYKMKFVYAHFPVNCNIPDDGKFVEIHNFLGEKVVRRVHMLEGVKVTRSTEKDEIILTGNDLELVSQSAANVHQSVLVKNKDIRKFLDGIYVSEKKVIGQE
ncbi:ribosomal protein L6, putative [Acanthamoeba castellanii str. Neff]|uniref:Ribosomal protein L6, putative n=1 Tax=Acanthamoeba castellanii (strain ATCC 30010 / Neff) TaxID=1257118 RepID=L8GJF7_ACACF|nr:ribosomal protein L6, putative [Acanthamoeba castellanii str. Neff]ELR12883.1 ribosomal protein L6, putative [Acanthamoeba castellanii str. Neff]